MILIVAGALIVGALLFPLLSYMILRLGIQANAKLKPSQRNQTWGAAYLVVVAMMALTGVFLQFLTGDPTLLQMSLLAGFVVMIFLPLQLTLGARRKSKQKRLSNESAVQPSQTASRLVEQGTDDLSLLESKRYPQINPLTYQRLQESEL